MKNLIEYFLNGIFAQKFVSNNTIESYRRDLNIFLTYILENKKIASDDKILLSLEKDDVNSFLSHLTDKGYKKSTICRMISSLRSFYNFLFDEKSIIANPMLYISSPKVKRSLPNVASEKTIVDLIEFAMLDQSVCGQKVYFILELLYGTGLRVSELISIRLGDFIKSENGLLLLIKGKGGKERVVPLTHMSEIALKNYLNNHSEINDIKSYLFPSGNASQSQKGHITRQRVGQIIKDICKKSGMYVDLSPHGVRHAFATHMLENGSNLVAVKMLLGHSDIGTTQIYTHVMTDKLTEVTEKYHPLSTKCVKDDL